MTTPPDTPSHPRVLIAAFEGWSDAGAATTTVLQHLGELIRAEVMHVIGAEGFVDFQVHRPKIVFDEQGNRVLDWPDTRLFGTVQRPGAEPRPISETVHRIDGTAVSDLFLLAGVEPARDWQSYADEIIELVDVWGIDTVILLGSMFSDAPHSRPIMTSVTTESEDRRAETGATRSTYEGPAGIGTVIDLALAEAGISAISLWAQVPHYVHSAPSPKATLALLDKIEELLDVVIPRGDLISEANEWEENINRIASEDEEMTQYIRRLEESRDAVLAAEATGDALALEFEKFLDQHPERGEEAEGENRGGGDRDDTGLEPTGPEPTDPDEAPSEAPDEDDRNGADRSDSDRDEPEQQ